MAQIKALRHAVTHRDEIDDLIRKLMTTHEVILTVEEGSIGGLVIVGGYLVSRARGSEASPGPSPSASASVTPSSTWRRFSRQARTPFLTCSSSSWNKSTFK